MIAILDYGIGNLRSIGNMLSKIGVDNIITTDPETINKANKLILPGVGHFDYCMQQLKKAPFFDLLHKRVLEDEVPILGVCVGCQMLMEESEEGSEKGLGWLKGKVARFKKDILEQGLKIPHMGWTDVNCVSDSALYSDIVEPRFYFVHSYHLLCENPEDITATGNYGYDFVASVQRKNIQGVQFHPEKSHRFGMKLYSNFNQNF